MRIALCLVVCLLGGCASSANVLGTKNAGKALGVFAKHCTAYGPFKTKRSEDGKPAGVGFGAAVVCEQ